ncbi:VWA domain-containing protein [Pseudaminobacter sp. 19-2017]|uniref:VWA domain-containing protein n=1 Tax=Pseudaminobacter soli (ex Zhang et al. 2022) TaxID=2831468 RepID=A0A942I1V8_9HYPH|nr:VWA domain-containing protein [Pseudaminobacter soli]MBS3647344.1 VWA domain-containing protein [Pseudaminobacter soli]
MGDVLSKGLLVLGVLCSAPAIAADKAIIVLDGSGSMWGQIDGRPKLEIARETLDKILPTMPQGLELGLMAYGHRQKGQCGDIELIVGPAPGTGEAISKAVAGMRFLGKTPLSAAVEQAAAELRHSEDKATVILITDGIETCGADPCAVGASLAKAGVDLTVHVVGFGLSREEGRQVACLAENTGGRYISAADAGELGSALTETIAQPEPAAEPKSVELPKAGVAPAAKVAIGAGLAVEWSGPGADGDYVDLVPGGYEEPHGELSYRYVAEGPSLQLRAPSQVGTYDVRYIWAGPDKRYVLARSSVEVVDSEFAVIGPSSVVTGQQFEVVWKGPVNEGDYVDLVPAGHEQASGEISYFYVSRDPSSGPGKLHAPAEPGTYQLRYVLEAPDAKKVMVSVPLVVTQATASVALPPQIGAGTSVSVAWRGPNNQGDYVDLVLAGHSETSGELSYFYTGSSQDGETGMLRAPGAPGLYRVRYVMQAADDKRVLASQVVEVTAMEAAVTAPEAVTIGSRFPVEWNGPGSQGDYVDLVPAGHSITDGELSYFYADGSGDEKRGTLQAPGRPGDYQIRYVQQAADSKSVLAVRAVAVAPATATLSGPEALETQTEFAVEWTGPANEGDYIDLVPAGQDDIGGELSFVYVTSGAASGSGTLRAPDQPGNYLIRYVMSASDGQVVLESRPVTVQ